MEKEREPDRRTAHACKHDFRKAPLPKERSTQRILSCDYLVSQMLELGKLADKLQHKADFGFLGRPYADACHCAHQPVLCKPCAIPAMLASSASNRSRSERSLARQRCNRSTCMRFIGST